LSIDRKLGIRSEPGLKLKKKIAVFLPISMVIAGAAYGADLPNKKAPPAPPSTTSCFASFYDYMSASAQDCPLSYMGVTLYGQIDVGGGYSSHAGRFDSAYPNGVQELVGKFSNGARYQWVPNGLSQSNVGIKGREEFAPGWAFVFDANMGFDPYSLQLSNGPRSLVNNNNVTIGNQTANGDSSRAGQWDNARAYLGLSNSTFGTLTIGRQNTFSNDAVGAYDLLGGAYAFSLIGFSSSYVAGMGVTETTRYNTSVKYQVTYNNMRAGALWQFGGYDQGNGSKAAYQFDVGADYAGFSFDAIYSHATDAVALSAYAVNPLPAGVSQDDLKATLADTDGIVLAAKYTTGPFKLFGGYENVHFKPPSDNYVNGFSTLGDYTVLPGAVSVTNYVRNKILQAAWAGAKYAIRSDLDITAAYYWAGQNNYSSDANMANPAYCAANTKPAVPGATPQGSANSTCAGTLQAVSGMVDWRPYKRLDVYAGVMYSKASGGIASGYIHSDNIAPSAGVRLTF
jgi:predicted porin